MGVPGTWSIGANQGMDGHGMSSTYIAHEGAPPARANARSIALGAMNFPTDDFNRCRIGRQRAHVNGDRMNECRCRGKLERNARRLAGSSFGFGASALHAPRPAPLDDHPAGFALHLKSLFLDDRKNGENRLGSSKVLPTSTDDVGRQCKRGRKRRASFVGSIVAKSVSLTDVVCRGLVCREMGLDPSDGVGPEEQPPKISVDAIKEGGRREPSSTSCNATNEILRVHDRG